VQATRQAIDELLGSSNANPFDRSDHVTEVASLG